MARIIYKVRGESESASRCQLKARSFDITVDEPRSLGGNDLGPNPVEYLLAGLAGCINVIGHEVAEEMGFTIDRMNIEVRGKMERNEGSRPGFAENEVRLNVDSNVDQETLDRWAGLVEEQCPVADNLAAPTPVRMKVGTSDSVAAGANS